MQRFRLDFYVLSEIYMETIKVQTIKVIFRSLNLDQKAYLLKFPQYYQKD